MPDTLHDAEGRPLDNEGRIQYDEHGLWIARRDRPKLATPNPQPPAATQPEAPKSISVSEIYARRDREAGHE